MSSVPTTNQGLLIIKDASFVVFFSISATIILSVPVITIIGVGFLLVFFIQAFLQLIHCFSHRLSAGTRTFIKQYSTNIVIDIYTMLCFIVQWIYVVVTIEQTIQRNPVIHDGPRFPVTFGQVYCFFQVDYDVC